MGFFSNIFSQAKELTKLGNAVTNVKNMLDQYEIDSDPSFLLCSAWICKVGIIDMINKNNWAPNFIVYIPINGHHTKMYMTEVQIATIGRLKNKVSNLYDSSIEQTVNDIMEGGRSFYEIDRQIPLKIRNAIM